MSSFSRELYSQSVGQVVVSEGDTLYVSYSRHY